MKGADLGSDGIHPPTSHSAVLMDHLPRINSIDLRNRGLPKKRGGPG